MAPVTRSQHRQPGASSESSHDEEAEKLLPKKTKRSTGGGVVTNADAVMAEVSKLGFCLIILQLSAVAYVVCEGYHHNSGRKFIRVHQEGCHKAWVEIMAGGGAQGQVACCEATMEPGAWDAAICNAAMNPTTEVLTTLAALILPLVPFLINWALSFLTGLPSKVHLYHRRRLALYIAIIAFRTLILFKGLNVLQDLLQEAEGDKCWYAEKRRDGFCREQFDFADHVVLFVSQYLSIQTFEAIAILSEAKGRLHKLVGVIAVLALSIPCLVGAHHTVCFFHSQNETLAALAISKKCPPP